MGKSRSNLKKYIDDFFDDIELYDDFHNKHKYKDLLKAGIDVFLDNETTYNAFEIYQIFFMIYQITSENKSESKLDESKSIISEPNTLLNLVKIMKKYEENTGDLIDKQRDHFIHSVNVFLLGLAIYSQNKTYRDIFKQYILKSPYDKYYRFEESGNVKFSNEEFLYRWGIASLFHDIGYPVEIIGKQLKKFMNDGIKSISNYYDINTAIEFDDFNDFNSIVKFDPNFGQNYRKVYPEINFLDLYKPTDIMAHKITLDFPDVDIKDLINHLNDFVDIMAHGGFIDHGFFSSILVLNSYGYLIQKYSKNQDFFFYPIVDSGSAILLHNYYRNVMQKNPFNLEKLSPEDNPLAFLLILCDELQEWNRQPFGVKDKQKSHVNELLLNINNEKMDVEYIVKSGSMGLGFSEGKKGLIKSLLQTEAIFKQDLNIHTSINQDNIMREMVMAEIQAPDVLARNIEKLAMQIHDQYVETTVRQYEEQSAKGEVSKALQDSYDALCYNYDDLSPYFKIANVRQARSIPKKLESIGCEITHLSDSREAITEFSDDEIRDLAIMEHDEWCEEKRGTGWTYGEVKDNDNLVTPYLIPWQDLPKEIQQYDIDPVIKIPGYVESIGLKVVRSKIRLLTIKMHEFYTSEVDFNQLPEYIKYSNYNHASNLVKILNEINYDIVSKDIDGESINSFDDETLEFLVKREHEEWYKLMTNIGMEYGKIRSDKTNPNLVHWDKLDPKIKQSNKRTFKNLPMLCDEVDLKIIHTK